MRLRADLVKRPQLRATREAHERHATWLELFADLAYVAVFAQVGLFLKEDFSPQRIGLALILFTAVWWAWAGNTFYLSRFDQYDLWHRLTGLLQVALVVGLAAGAYRATDPNSLTFALCYIGLRLLLIGQYLYAGFHNPHLRKLTSVYATGFSLAVLFWIVSLFVPKPLAYSLWGIGLLIDIVTPRFNVKEAIKYPPNESHVPERFGLFTVIVLGETIIASVYGADFAHVGVYKGLLTLGGILIAFGIWWLYFEGVNAAAARAPSSRKEQTRFFVWLYSHLPLQFGIFLTGALFAKILSYKGEIDGHLKIALLASASVAQLMLHAIFEASIPPHLRELAKKVAWPHWVLTLSMVAVIPFAPLLSTGIIVAIIASMFAAQVLLTFRPIAEQIPAERTLPIRTAADL